MRIGKTLVRAGFAAVLLVGMLFVAGGCGTSTQEAIVGTWKLNEQEQTLEFHADGTLVLHEASGRTLTGSYEFADGTNVVLHLSGSSRTFEVDIRFNQMMLTSTTQAGSQSGIFTRVN
jgi:hypothetical protein